ncbi:Ran-specific GTPase-activating protein isoform X1 [Oopsacas minuta]|uniref:Ran-specific GTPase-activating protein n=1 Tax=Oopsacas minuta TaxID=111878 RepID=A0AAV7JQD2_9METZ|nr:Ran-specific GTPase-activating protein isoform X1 [Oopsacas minuta]
MSDSEKNIISSKEVTPSTPTQTEDKKDQVEGRSPSSPVFEPIVTLPEVKMDSMEENENDILKLRGKLYRFCMPLDDDDEPAVWKERGVGTVKLLEDKDTGKVRIVMRRDKTLKLCANHFITKDMALKPIVGNDRTWLWYTAGDFSDGEPNPETLCLRFESTENAKQFQSKFMDIVKALNSPTGQDMDELLNDLKIEDKDELD